MPFGHYTWGLKNGILPSKSRRIAAWGYLDEPSEQKDTRHKKKDGAGTSVACPKPIWRGYPTSS